MVIMPVGSQDKRECSGKIRMVLYKAVDLWKIQESIFFQKWHYYYVHTYTQYVYE